MLWFIRRSNDELHEGLTDKQSIIVSLVQMAVALILIAIIVLLT